MNLKRIKSAKSTNGSMSLALSINLIVLLIIAALIGIIFVEDKWSFIKGIGFGGLFTLLKIKLMEVTITKSIQKPPSAAKAYMNAHYMLRYILTFMVIFVGVLTPGLHPLGVIVGLLLLKPAVYIQGKLEPKTAHDEVTYLEWEDDEEEKSDFW